MVKCLRIKFRYDPDKQEEIRMFWMGKQPKSRLAVEEYISKECLTQREVAQKHNVTEATIRKHFRSLGRLHFLVWPSGRTWKPW